MLLDDAEDLEVGIRTVLTIDAPVSRAWAILTDFPHYRDWNPTLEILAGEPVAGQTIRVRAGKGSPDQRDFDATVVEVTAPYLLTWEGADPAALSGRHRFELSAREPGDHDRQPGTHLVNVETFSGPAAPSALADHRDAIEAEYAAFNDALRSAAER